MAAGTAALLGAAMQSGDAWRAELEKWVAKLPCEAGRRCGKCMPCAARGVRSARRALHQVGDSAKACVKCSAVIAVPVLAASEPERCANCADPE